MDNDEKDILAPASVSEEDSQSNQQNPLSIPFAIIIAGVIIAASVVYSFSGRQAPSVSDNALGQKENQQLAAASPSIANVVPVSSSDHIRGNPDAAVKIIEFSDLECPFCKQFQTTMEQVSLAYGNKIAWIYRHYPIAQLHSRAQHEAVASECATEQGGNDMFWKYIDGIFQITPSNNKLDPVQLNAVAEKLGLDTQKFDACLSSNRYDQKIESQIEDALKSGSQGTPYSVVMVGDKPVTSIDGAYNFASVKQVIDSVISQGK